MGSCRVGVFDVPHVQLLNAKSILGSSVTAVHLAGRGGDIEMLAGDTRDGVGAAVTVQAGFTADAQESGGMLSLSAGL